MPRNNTAYDDEITRIYLDDIGRVPLIDQKKEQEYALPIQRRQYIRAMRQNGETSDPAGTVRLLKRIYDNAAIITGLFREAGLGPDPRLSEMAGEKAFHALVDNPPQEETIRTAMRCGRIKDEAAAVERIRTISLDTLCITDVAIHVTDDCRLSMLPVHLSDPLFKARITQLGHHLSEQLDELCRQGDVCQQKLAEANLRLVVSIAKNYVGLNIPLADLIQEGGVGLMTGAERFDHRRGLKFSTFATWWIRHTIHQCLTKQRRTVRLPEHKIKLISQITNARRALSQDNQRTPTDEEVAEFLEIDVALVQNADMIRQPIANLDDLVGDTETTLGETIPSADPSVEDEVCETDRNEVLHRALGLLDERERAVLILRYGLNDDSPSTITETATALKMKNEDVREAERAALTKLQERADLREMLIDYR